MSILRNLLKVLGETLLATAIILTCIFFAILLGIAGEETIVND